MARNGAMPVPVAMKTASFAGSRTTKNPSGADISMESPGFMAKQMRSERRLRAPDSSRVRSDCHRAARRWNKARVIFLPSSVSLNETNWPGLKWSCCDFGDFEHEVADFGRDVVKFEDRGFHAVSCGQCFAGAIEQSLDQRRVAIERRSDLNFDVAVGARGVAGQARQVALHVRAERQEIRDDDDALGAARDEQCRWRR